MLVESVEVCQKLLNRGKVISYEEMLERLNGVLHVIALAAYAMEGDQEKVLQAGCARRHFVLSFVDVDNHPKIGHPKLRETHMPYEHKTQPSRGSERSLCASPRFMMGSLLERTLRNCQNTGWP